MNQLLHIAGNGAVPNLVLPHRVMPAPRRRDMGPEPLDWTGRPGADSSNAEAGDAPKKPGKAKARRNFRWPLTRASSRSRGAARRSRC